MATVRDLIEDALRKIHVLGTGQNLTPEQAQQSLSTLNDLMGSWSVEGGLVFTETTETFTLSPNQQQYTIGVGASDFDTVNPFLIEIAYVTNGTTDYVVELYDQKQWGAISTKNTSGIPQVLYYDNNTPIGNIYLYPLPSSVDTLTLSSRKPITAFTSLDEVLVLPAGYKRALTFNLAVDIAPEYEKEPSNTVINIANQAKANVFSYNARNDNNLSSTDSALMLDNDNTFNINTGTY